MLISDYDYQLPAELIAQQPSLQRDASRMLVVDRQKKKWKDSTFATFPSHIKPRDVIVVNNTRVFPARLIGTIAPQRTELPAVSNVELFLVHEVEENVWEVLVKPGRRFEKGARIQFGEGKLEAQVLDILPTGRRLVRFYHEEPFEKLLEELGQTPLPPYIKRIEGPDQKDRQRYQTIYARNSGAIAAPTAGFHFTNKTFEEIRAGGASVAQITLHVGYGTFEPVHATDLKDHRVEPERFEISPEATETINDARKNGGRIIAVGTTTTRALESATDESGHLKAGVGLASLTIVPGYKFLCVDALLTNFHLPRSSLLVLVSTFAGRDLTLAAYRHAVEEKYRFYSYGDCMLIV